MTVPYAKCGDQRIYYVVEGSGPPLLLYHGFGGSSSDWEDFGVAGPLRERYRLIMLDARGHGRSGKAVDPAAYSLDRKIAGVIAVLDDLGVKRTHFYGYSYGGLMGWALGMNVPQRFASMVIGGAQPYEPTGEEMYGRFHAMMDHLGLGMPAYVRWREEHGVVWPEGFRSRMLANDPAALSAYLGATLDHYPLGDLGRMDMPVLVVSGDDDELMAGSLARQAAGLLPDGRYVEIPDADHPALYIDGGRVVPFIEHFLDEVEGAVPNTAVPLLSPGPI